MSLTKRVAVAIVCSCLPTAQADDALWPKLIDRAQDDRAPVGARSAALGLACERADQPGAAQVLVMAADWTQQIDQSGLDNEQIARNPGLAARRDLISALACNGGGARLNAGAGDPIALLQLWTAIASRSWTSREAKEGATALIATNTSPIAARRDAAFALLRFSGVGQAGAMPVDLAALFDASCVWPLRTMLREQRDPRLFNFTAAAWLADHADATILPDLQRLQPAFEAAHARFGRALAWYSWQIQVQNPPSGLLSHIASASLYTVESRRWALRRAVELGLPSADIRQAVLDYAAAGRPFGPDRLAAGIGAIKALGVQLGVLAPSDLPNVPARANEQTDAAPRRHTWDLATPAVNWSVPWEPRWENFDAYFAWLGTRPWQGLSPQDSAALLRQRACELGLFPPQQCAP